MSQEIAADETQAVGLENVAARKNAILLSICQALSGSASPLSVALGGIVGSYLLAGDKTLATLPVTGFTLGVALMSVPAALLMRRIGRRRGFISGALIGMLGMALAVTAITAQMFWLFVVALLAIGAANSFTQQYRFAAADRGTAEFKTKAISWVLAGGVAASLIGPQMILFFSDFLAPIPFAGAFLWGTGLFSLSILAMLFLEPGHPPRSAEEIANKKSRPLSELAAQPKFLVAVFCATGSYAIMAFIMTAAPLAMLSDGFNVHYSTWGIQWHALAMFAPSFFTGNLIARFGKSRIIATGLFLLIAAALLGINGVSLAHYYLGLILLGIGWNFGFIGSTTLLTETYEPQERSKAQGTNDFIVFSTVAFASLMSGVMLNHLDWFFLNGLVLPIALSCLASLGWLAAKSRVVVQR